jgi:exosortase A-associated hydrolase 1
MGRNMRRIVEFTCDGAMLLGTADIGAATTGLLIVSGGNEIRIGAHRGMAQLAGEIAAQGFPVFRFDRRGIGDSEGDNGGFEASRADIVAALAAFRAEFPDMQRVVAFGNCDAATALWLHQPLTIDVLVVANPWLLEPSADAPPPATTRAYYARRLRDPRAWGGLFKGAVNLRRLFGSLRTATQRDALSSLATRVAAQIAQHPVPTRILLAEHDGTAVAFKAQWDGSAFDGCRAAAHLSSFNSSSHSFANDDDYSLLKKTILEALDQ